VPAPTRGSLQQVSLLIALVLTTLLLASAANAQTRIAFGYQDIPYATSTDGDITGEKPESKLWWNAGRWWGVLWHNAQANYHIYHLDLATQAWMDTGVAVDNRRDSRVDVLWDGATGKLYVVSHLFAQNSGQASAVPSEWGRLYRFSFDATAQSYSLDPGFPVDVNQGKHETLVLAKDSTGQLWVAFVQSRRLMVSHSVGGDDQLWSAPYVLPVPDADNLSSDDICSIIAYSGKIGVMWNNSNTKKMHFASHVDGAPDTAWQATVAYSIGQDDHINLKTVSFGGQDYLVAVIKTNRSTELIVLLVCTNGLCTSSGDWTSRNIYDGQFVPTRPILMLNEEVGDLYVFARVKPSGAGTAEEAIYYKKTALDNIAFTPGDIGIPFIRDTTVLHLNNPTSTKQNVNSATGLVVLAGDDQLDTYFHNYLAFAAETLPVITSFTPTSGVVGTEVTITGLRLTGATEVAFNGTPASFTVDSDTQIRATVLLQSSTGSISVTTPAGTAQSASDFTVFYSPEIFSFSPGSGPPDTEVTIVGTGFTGTTNVTFGGVSATFATDSDTQIRARVPASAPTGKIAVTNPAGTATSAADFVVTIPDTLTLAPVADAQVKSSSPTTNYGTLDSLRLREGTPSNPITYHSYLMFNVTGLSRPLTSAKLRLFVTDGSDHGGNVSTTSNSWLESSIVWNNAPAPGAFLANAGPVTTGTWVEITLPASAFAAGNGTYSFVLITTSSNSTIFYSREGANPPQLVLTQ